MGAHSRRGRKKRPANSSAQTAPSSPPPPVCVAKLFSPNWSLIEEGCVDATAFALQPAAHASLLAHAVPQRLAALLFTDPRVWTADVSDASIENAAEEASPCVGRGFPRHVHRGVLYMQTAAAEALRNCIVNSAEDVVVDVLAAASVAPIVGAVDGAEGAAAATLPFGDAFAAHLLRTWEITQAGCEAPSLAVPDAQTAARLLDESLQLAAVCVEGSERVATALSAPHVVHALLDMTASATGRVWETLRHGDALASPMAAEAALLAGVAVAASEVLHVLSGDNEAMAGWMRSAEAMAPHQTFLHDAVDAVGIMEMLRNTPTGNTNNNNTNEALAAEEEVWPERVHLVLQLCEVSLRVQGTLIHTAPTPTNAARVLPLVVAVLDAHPPQREWRRAVPLLLETCALTEEMRVGRLASSVCALRCAQAALNVLHSVVDAICGMNRPDTEDETAFQQNKHAGLLYETNAMLTVGRLMRDALRLTGGVEGGNGGNGANGVSDVLMDRALRAAAGAAGATGGLITKLQFLVLSSEVAVWSLANTLLLMVPWSSLGEDPAHIWRAILTALHARYKTLMDAANTDACDTHIPQNGGGARPNVLATSPAASHLLWLQLESLMQMLWTLQRKQGAAGFGSDPNRNRLAAIASDVDTITRLAWEPNATALLRLACVATTCAVCAAFEDTHATAVAARFALAALQMEDDAICALAGGLSAPPAVCAERRRWMAVFVKADAAWRVRCEAANQLMDLFLDERFDAEVYVPLRVHAGLQSFLPAFQTYMRRRQQLGRDTQRHYRVTLPEVEDVEHWQEVAENLDAFLAYKTKEIGRERLAA